MNTPLISCIMNTSDRRAFIGRAIEYFFRQTYAPRELIIIDDGEDSIADLVPSDDRIRYVRLREGLGNGMRRNIACENARGELIAHWGDMDWHATWRLEYQVEQLLSSEASICGIQTQLFYDVTTRKAWSYTHSTMWAPGLGGNSLCYRRTLWQEQKFDNRTSDNRFALGVPRRLACQLADNTYHVGIWCSRSPIDEKWSEISVDEIERIIGPEDWPFYASYSESNGIAEDLTKDVQRHAGRPD